MKTQINASIRMPPALHARVVNLAESRQRTPHALMLQAIESYISREEKREALRQDARSAHDEYMRTGLHLTNDEVRAWIDQLRQGNKVPMPKCHI